MKHVVGLLDTSTVLRMSELDAEDLPEQVVISSITLAELSLGPLVTNDERKRAVRQAQVQQVEADYGEPLPFGVSAARAFAQVAADFRLAGSKSKARSYDALIAAVAVASELPLYTFNPRDFTAVSGLTVVALPRSA